MRTTIWIASLAVVLTAAVGLGRLWAEDKEEKPAKPAPRTRIAVINLTYVIKNYDKYKNFQETIKTVTKKFQERDKKLRARGEKMAKKKENPTIVQAKSEEIEESLKKLQREIEDNNAEAKLVLGKKTDAEMKLLYTDVQEAAQSYALAHDFEMVLHYNDAVTKEDYFSAMNMARKVQTGALMPMYAAPGLDVSMDIVEALNKGMVKK